MIRAAALVALFLAFPACKRDGRSTSISAATAGAAGTSSDGSEAVVTAKNGKVQLIINTPTKKGPQTDEGKIRALTVMNKIPMITTLTGAHAAAQAIGAMQAEDWTVRPLQEYFQPS